MLSKAFLWNKYLLFMGFILPYWSAFRLYLDTTEKCKVGLPFFSSSSCFTEHLSRSILSASCHYWVKLWPCLIPGKNLLEFSGTKITQNKLRKKLKFGSILILEVLACLRTWRQFWLDSAEGFGQGHILYGFIFDWMWRNTSFMQEGRI